MQGWRGFENATDKAVIPTGPTDIIVTFYLQLWVI